MDSGKDRKRIEDVLREPLTRHRLTLNGKIRAAQQPEEPQPFTLDDLKNFIAGVRSNKPDFQQEAQNVLQAVTTGEAPREPKFDAPETQLIWGAALAYLTLNPDQMKSWAKPPEEGAALGDTPLWKQVSDTRAARQELLSHGYHIREALRDKDTKYSWGAPGTGFGYDRQKNHINIDLMQSMIVGFEHARADVYREVGHSLLSVTYPKRMQQVFREMQPLLKKARAAQESKGKKGAQLKPEEYKKLRMLSTEWQLRHMMFAAAEENVANRFVANMGQQLLQDYGVSINNTAVTLRAVGLTRVPPKDKASDELRRYMNLCNAVQLSFYQNNDLFPDTDAGWSKVGVDGGRVRKTATLAKRPADKQDDADGIGHPDFQHLRELCGGPKGLENQQPKQHERLYGWANLSNRVQRADQERKSIVEEIWRDYGEDLIQKILTQANDQIDQQLKEAQQNQQQQQQDQDQDGEEQEGQDQDGQEGQEGQGQGKPQKGKGKKGKKQRGQPQGDPEDADDADDGDESGEQQDGEDQDGQEGQDGQDGDEGQEQDSDQKQSGAEGKLGTDEDETVPVEGAGDMPAPETPTEAPADELDPGEGKDADGEGEEADGQTVDDMEKDLDKSEDGDAADGDDADADGEEADGKSKKGKPQKGKGGDEAGKGGDESLGDLSKKDWTQYAERIAELAGPISRVRRLFKDVQDRQLQRKSAMSKTLDILPENGEVKDRFNVEAHRNLTIKKQTGQVEESDLKRFHKDEVKMVPTEIDIVIAIDGSGSMNGTAINSALQASAILYEAAAGKDMKMNVYVVMWGSNDPPVLIKPGDDRMKIGKAMEGARKGLNSGTEFAPAVKKIAQTIGDQHGRNGTLSGFTHILVLSDGDMFDRDSAHKAIGTMFDYSDKVTFDVAIIGHADTNMEKMAKDFRKGRKTFQEIGVFLGKDPEKIPMGIVGLLLEKVRKCGSFTAVPNSQKRRAMKKAQNKMDRKP